MSSVPDYPWCLKKREILTVSEFDAIRRGSYILQDDSIGEARFIIRDLEKFRILTEITVLPFFKKLEFFSPVLQDKGWLFLDIKNKQLLVFSPSKTTSKRENLKEEFTSKKQHES